MRKLSLLFLLHCSICMLTAQPPKEQSPPSIEQLVKKHHDAIAKAIKITPVKLKKVDEVYKQFFTKIITSNKEMLHRVGHRPPMLPRVEIDKLVAERNTTFKSFLTEAEYKAVLRVDEQLRPKPLVEKY